MRLILGLGNPDPKYEGTRHNIGFDVIDRLADKNGISLARERFQSRFGKGRIKQNEVFLAKPLTYMNLSGSAVTRIVNFFRIEPADIIVVHDELDIELGRMKIVARAGPAGHKGVGSIIQALGTKDFPRVRVGIGRPPEFGDGASFVLGRFGPEEKELMEKVLADAAEAVTMIVSEGVVAAQARFNRRVLCNE